MSHDPSAGPATQLGNAADAVGMQCVSKIVCTSPDPVGRIFNGTGHPVDSRQQPGVNQHYAVLDDDRIGVQVSDGGLDDAVDHLTRCRHLPRTAGAGRR